MLWLILHFLLYYYTLELFDDIKRKRKICTHLEDFKEIFKEMSAQRGINTIFKSNMSNNCSKLSTVILDRLVGPERKSWMIRRLILLNN